jgi:predicted transcriptional regulator
MPTATEDRHKRPVTAVRLRPETRRRLDAIALANDISMNWVVNRLLEEALNRDDLPLDFQMPA